MKEVSTIAASIVDQHGRAPRAIPAPSAPDRARLDSYEALLPTRADVDAMTALEAHDLYCDGGYIPALQYQHGRWSSAQFRCRHCEAQRGVTDARAALELSGIGARYLDVTWDDLAMPEPLPALKRASDDVTAVIQSGHSALLAGAPGSGKTQAAALIMRAAIEAGHTAVLENVGSLAMRIRAGYDDADGVTEAGSVARLSAPDLLVLDDVGAGEAGDGKIEKRVLYFVLDARQNARRATLLTSNLTAQQVGAFLGARIMNRLMPLKVFAFAHGVNFRKPDGRNAWDVES